MFSDSLCSNQIICEKDVIFHQCMPINSLQRLLGIVREESAIFLLK